EGTLNSFSFKCHYRLDALRESQSQASLLQGLTMFSLETQIHFTGNQKPFVHYVIIIVSNVLSQGMPLAAKPILMLQLQIDHLPTLQNSHTVLVALPLSFPLEVPFLGKNSIIVCPCLDALLLNLNLFSVSAIYSATSIILIIISDVGNYVVLKLNVLIIIKGKFF
ncbi:hypothetical protein ACJX0J_019936, partial [Zea mays]